MSRRAAAIAWAALAAFVLYGSVNPIAHDAGRRQAQPGISLPDIAQNLLLYFPFGVFGVWALRRDSSSRRDVYVRVTATAAIYSGAMELLQLASASRYASRLDVIANAAGAFAGTLASGFGERILGMLAEKIRPTGLLTAKARYVLGAVLAAVVWSAWYPFDVTLDVSTLSDRTRPVRLDPWLAPAAAELWGQAGRYFVLAAILTTCLPGLERRAALAAALAAVAVAVVTDVGQLAMGSQPVGGAVLVSQAAGACAGAGATLLVTLVRRTWYALA